MLTSSSAGPWWRVRGGQDLRADAGKTDPSATLKGPLSALALASPPLPWPWLQPPPLS